MSDLRTLHYHFESDGLSGTRIQAAAVTLLESLDEPYMAEVEVEIDDPDADLAELLGENCVLTIERQPDAIRRLCGIVCAVHYREKRTPDRAGARLVIVPALWMLSKRRDTRIFQNKSVRDIAEEVLQKALGDYGRKLQIDLTATYPTREYCVQYQETDLAFVHRLLREEGITYAFDHEGDTEVMILRDKNTKHPRLKVPKDGLVRYEPQNLIVRHAEPVNRVFRVESERTTSVVVCDWDWTRAEMPFNAEQRGEDSLGRDRESYEHGEGRSLSIYDYKPNAYGKEDSTTQARLRNEAHRVDAIVLHGIGRVTGMSPGQRFLITGHPTLGMDGEYLLTRVQHVSSACGIIDEPGSGATENYHNRFECIPVDVPHRPKRITHKPNIASIQTAVVTGPGGEEIHVDEHGRIKVQFHWDRVGKNDEHTSCWVRVQQSWSGSGWGFWYVPRIGMEVVVQFVDGDPDRPLVTGCVYNGTNALPYGMPDEKTKSTMKSNSSIGGGGFNEFRYEDKAGSEEIFTHAQKDYNEVVENDHNTLVHHDQTNTVDHDQTQLVGNDQTETVNNNQMMTVDANRTVHVKCDYDETVDGTETRHVVGNVTETFSANETRTVTADLTETITGNEKRDVGGDLTETIGADHTQTISSSLERTITGSLSRTVTGGISTTTPATYDITAVGGLTVTAAAGIKLVAAGGIQVMAPAGITQLDSYFDWAGAKKLELCVLATEVMNIKVGATGVDIGVTNLKIEATDVVMGTKGVDIKPQTTAALKSGAARIYAAAAWLQTSGITNYF